jgi:hypothetical protein
MTRSCHGQPPELERDISAVARRLRRLRLLPRRHDVRQLADETQRINLVIMLPGRKTPATADVEGHLSLPPIGKCAWIVTAKPSRLHQLHQPHPAPAGRGAGRAAGDAAARVYHMTCKHSHCAYVRGDCLAGGCASVSHNVGAPSTVDVGARRCCRSTLAWAATRRQGLQLRHEWINELHDQ